MAGVALLAQTALMYIVLGVAAAAGGLRIAERLRRMALHAAHDAVQTEQRVLRQVVIEADVGAPGILAVACGTLSGHLAAVGIFAAMAALAILRQLVLSLSRMTGVAVELGVRAFEGKFVPSGMVVDERMPLVVAVAIAALRTKTARMRVVGAVAAVAILRDPVFVVAAAVTSETVDLGMRAEQRVTGLLRVIELGALPVLGSMTFAAVRTARTAMLVIGSMATDA